MQYLCHHWKFCWSNEFHFHSVNQSDGGCRNLQIIIGTLVVVVPLVRAIRSCHHRCQRRHRQWFLPPPPGQRRQLCQHCSPGACSGGDWCRSRLRYIPIALPQIIIGALVVVVPLVCALWSCHHQCQGRLRRQFLPPLPWRPCVHIRHQWSILIDDDYFISLSFIIDDRCLH